MKNNLRKVGKSIRKYNAKGYTMQKLAVPLTDKMFNSRKKTKADSTQIIRWFRDNRRIMNQNRNYSTINIERLLKDRKIYGRFRKFS